MNVYFCFFLFSFSLLTKRLVGKNVSEMNHIVTQSVNASELASLRSW